MRKFHLLRDSQTIINQNVGRNVNIKKAIQAGGFKAGDAGKVILLKKWQRTWLNCVVLVFCGRKICKG